MLHIYLAMLETPEEKSKMADLYHTYRELMFNVALNILRNEADAEDVLHQAFVRIAGDFKKIGDISSHQTRNYLVIIVRGLALNLYNKRSKIIEVPFDLLEGTGDYPLHDLNVEQIEYEALYQALEQLPSEQRDALYLMYYEEFSVKEICIALNLSENAAKKRLQRARLAVQKILTKEGIETK